MTRASPGSARPLDLPSSEPAGVRLIPSWPLLIGLAVFARLLVARLALLNDPDTYLHIAAGRWILAHRALPLQDPFSHSMRGANWISSEWLAEIGLACLYGIGGWSGVVVATAACEASAIALLLYFLLRRFDTIPALITALASAALLQPHALARPHVFALPILVGWVGLLFKARDDEASPPFAALPLMLLWANLHASYLIGLAVAAYLAAEAVLQPGASSSRRQEAARWAIFAAASLAAALLTPYGPAGLLQPLRLMQMPALQSIFTEWLSPDFQKSPALEVWLLGILFIGFASGARLRPTRLLLLLGLVHLCLQHSRHADVLATIGPLAVAASLGPQLSRLMENHSPSPLFAAADRLARPARGVAIVVALLIGAAIASPLLLHPIVRGDDAVTPASALAAAQNASVSGPVFNSQAFGGYLVFRDVPTLIDGRIEMYGNDFLAKEYEAERGDPAAIEELIARYRIDWALLAAGVGALGMFDHLPGWTRLYSDRYASVYRRTEPIGRKPGE